MNALVMSSAPSCYVMQRDLDEICPHLAYKQKKKKDADFFCSPCDVFANAPESFGFLLSK